MIAQQQESPPPKEKNSPHDTALDEHETTPGGLIHETNVTDHSEKSNHVEGSHDGKDEGQSGNYQEQTRQNDTCRKFGGQTVGNGGDHHNTVNSQGGGTGDDLEKVKKVSDQTDEGDDGSNPLSVDKFPDRNRPDNHETSAAAGGHGMVTNWASISYRKRGRDGNPIDHIPSSSGSKPRKKGELELPSCPPTCYVCKKPFGSWKAVFGHLRAHRRLTPGAFPPPTFTPPKGSPEKGNDNGDEIALKEQLVPTLLNLARQTMVKMSQDNSNTAPSTAEVASSSSLSSRRGLTISIDLNEPKTSVLLDLNESAPPEEDRDDIDDEHHQN